MMKKAAILAGVLALLALASYAQPPWPYTGVDMGNLIPCYPTLTNNPGHGLSGIAWLGPCITAEDTPAVCTSLTSDCFGNAASQQQATSLDPCTDGAAFFGVPWEPCAMVTAAVMVTAGSNYAAYAQSGGHLYLSAWLDGDQSGNFDQEACGGSASEWIIQDSVVTPGIHLYSFLNPGVRTQGSHYPGIFRFRLGSHPFGRFGYGYGAVFADSTFHCPLVQGNDSTDHHLYGLPFGFDYLGEVEDYLLCDVMLNVSLADFDAIGGDNAVTLNWTTASEALNDHFEIMRDGVSISEVPTKGNDATGHTYAFIDVHAANGTAYSYALMAVDVNGGRQELHTAAATPIAGAGAVTDYALNQNYPNPFNPSTSISFDLKEEGFTTLRVYNMVGQEVATLVNSSLPQGRHTVNFDAASLPSGLYVYRVEANGYSAVRKMLLLK
ncbi:MAG TPA: T9SS type A sorting domain-containing protein [bacterium]|jgi:hypothetical protein